MWGGLITDLCGHLSADLLLGLSQAFLGQFRPPVTLGDERLQMIHCLQELETEKVSKPAHPKRSIAAVGTLLWQEAITYIQLKEQVSLLGGNFVIGPKCQVVNLSALSQVHALNGDHTERNQTFAL